MVYNLPATISSKEDLMSLIIEIRGYAKWFNQYVIAERVQTQYTQPQPELSPAAIEILKLARSADGMTSASLEALIAQLETTKAQAKVMTITLAAPATNEVKKALVAWARSNIAPDILISFRFNSTLLGGMVVRFGSRIFDWSFRRTILNERYRFGEVLTRV
ncbi:F0F1 ATP synthase subunit delta [Candidatus Saccharibacteria bacterium]|nr:MAG: F0F1 ATP synthase subunit delta [Candidatus Saccharibacteria bacterium]